jgi:DNA-binding response OmpR family regulator
VSVSDEANLRVAVVIEDDAAIADLLDMYLRDDGFRVLQAASGERGLELLAQHDASLVLVDIGLPGIDGFEVVRRMREWSSAAVLMVTAREEEVDRIVGLELGADDYVVKPFSPREVVARVHAVLRRGTTVPPRPLLAAGRGVQVDVARREVLVEGAPVALTAREFDLLAHFALHKGIALTRRQLLDQVWGPQRDGGERTVDVHVRQLRKKVGPTLPLETVWSVGYRLG